MEIGEVHAVVIGAGIGGLSVAAMLARRGMQVTVLEAGASPGGCARTFRSGGYRFDAGATVGCGFHPGGPLDELGKELDLQWPVLSEPVAWQYRRRGMRLDLDRTRAAVADRFPGSPPFWREQATVAAMLWRISGGGLPWPPALPSDLLRLVRKVAPELPNAGVLARFMGRTAHDWLAAHGLDRQADFVRFIDSQLMISAQASSHEVNALVAAIALDLPASGTWQVHGGIGRIAELLVSSVERIVAARRFSAITPDGIRKIGVVMKRAKYFITCSGRPFEKIDREPLRLCQSLLLGDGAEPVQPRQLVLFQ